MTRPKGVDVMLLDGHIFVSRAESFTITEEGCLLLFSTGGVEVASFGVGEWVSAALRELPRRPWWRRSRG